MSPPPRIYAPSAPGVSGPLRQGEILSDLVQVHLDVKCVGKKKNRLAQRVHPDALILTQDCDLEQDFRARVQAAATDKLIPAILFCEVVTAEQLRGNAAINSSLWSRIKINKDERYHFFQKVEPADDARRQGLPELGIDFKRYFTIPVDEVYRRVEIGEANCRCVLVSPYLEHLSSRFTFFLSRIGLPQDHISE